MWTCTDCTQIIFQDYKEKLNQQVNEQNHKMWLAQAYGEWLRKIRNYIGKNKDLLSDLQADLHYLFVNIKLPNDRETIYNVQEEIKS